MAAVVAIDPYATINTGKGTRVFSPGEGVNDATIALSDTDDNIIRHSDQAAVICKAFFLTVAADVSVICMDGSTLTLPALPAYTRIDVRVRRFRSTGTTAAAATIKAIL